MKLDRALVRHMTENDLELVYGWRNSLEVRKYSFTKTEFTFEEHAHWFHTNLQSGNKAFLVVEVMDEPVGFVQFNNTKPDGEAEWSFYARPDAIRGTGTSLCAAALTYGFFELKLSKITGQVLDHNRKSIAIHKKLGFQSQGMLREKYKLGNTYHAVHIFAIFPNEWQKREALLTLSSKTL